jgi:biopolymer transport protein ExbB
MTAERGTLRKLMAAAGVLVCLVGTAAAAGEDAGAVSGAGMRLSWINAIRDGGWPMYILVGMLAAMSLLAVAFIVYFFVVLRVGQVVPRPLLRELLEKIRSGAIDDARRACDYRPCALSDVTTLVIDYMSDVPDISPSLLKDVLEGEGARQAELVQGQTQYLLDIAVISPMVGLLGTVFGMLRAFATLALNATSAKPIELAFGISQALITTAFGLIVGIPAMIFYAYFRRRASKLIALLEAASTDVLAALLSKRSA